MALAVSAAARRCSSYARGVAPPTAAFYSSSTFVRRGGFEANGERAISASASSTSTSGPRRWNEPSAGGSLDIVQHGGGANDVAWARTEVRPSGSVVARRQPCSPLREMPGQERSGTDLKMYMSSVTSSGRSRFVLDGNGKRIRNPVSIDAGRGDKNAVGNDGGRGGGSGGGHSRSGGRSKHHPSIITASISRAECARDILSIIADKLNDMNYVNVSTAFNRLGKLSKTLDFSTLDLAANGDFRELLGLTRELAKEGNFGVQAVANTMHGIARLHEAGRLEATDGSVDGTLAALEAEVVRVAPDATSQHVSIILWSYAKLGRTPNDQTWEALENALERVLLDFVPSLAGSGIPHDVKPLEVRHVMWSYATLGRMPGSNAWAALEKQSKQIAQIANSQEAATLTWAYGTFGRPPAGKVWRELEMAADRLVHNISGEHVTNALWAFSTLYIVQRVYRPTCYAKMWDRVCQLKLSDFSEDSLATLFQVHLMHTFTGPREPVNVMYPPWLMVDARRAWMSKVEHANSTISRSQRKLASAFDELGVRYEVQRMTDDGYYSMGIYLPEYDIAVELDGPTNYYQAGDTLSSQDIPMVKTAKTKLRDFLLARQCARVVTVPWFEWRDVRNAREKRTQYLRDKLARAGFTVSSRQIANQHAHDQR